MVQLACPGDLLATSEEFLAGKGAFEEDGKVYSLFIGKEQADPKKRTIGVEGKGVRYLTRGDLIYGRVQDIYDQIALIHFRAPASVASPSTSAFIRISEVQRGYTRNFRDVLRIGDVVKARILEVKEQGIYLSMKERDLGVVKAFCSNCRGELEGAGKFLSCKECGNTESRKMAFD